MSTSTHENSDASATVGAAIDASMAAEANGGASSEAMEAVRALMDERRRFEGWLTTLETRRGATPPRVYERVRGDYEQRLDGVIAELRGHTAMLRTTLADLTSRAQALRAEEDTRREERAEGELRAMVGEYTPARWQELSASADADIERLSNDRGELTAEVVRVQEMLAQTEAPRTPPGGSVAVEAPADAPAEAPEAAAVAEPVPAAVVEQEDAAAADVPTGPAPTEVPADVYASAFADDTEVAPIARQSAAAGSAASAMPPIDALGFDNSVGAESYAPSAANDAASAARTGDAAPGIDLLGGNTAFDELAFLDSVVGPRGTPTTNITNLANMAAGAGSATGGDARRDARGENRNDSPFGTPSDATKTLRCGECGTMNSPTEWYCERCGGELAAL